jgi:hypothetical protein
MRAQASPRVLRDWHRPPLLGHTHTT